MAAPTSTTPRPATPAVPGTPAAPSAPHAPEPYDPTQAAPSLPETPAKAARPLAASNADPLQITAQKPGEKQINSESQMADALTTSLPAKRILIIGDPSLCSRLPAGVHADAAENFLEAVLLITPTTHYDAIFATVAQEIDQLESAVTSIKKVAATTKLHLLCDPVDEPECRRARAYGADNYHLLPLSKSTLDRLLNPARPAKNLRHAHSPADLLTAPVSLSIAQIPLVVESVIIADLLSGRPDFVDRAVGTLQGYMKWHGRLRFHAQLPDESADLSITRAVVSFQDLTFGTLTLQNIAGPDSAEASLLNQAAHWLGSYLALAHRQTQLQTLAITDELSGAYNRRYFTRFTASLLQRAEAERFAVTVMLFDIDNFKQYNDEFGHASGDSIIREVTRLLRTCTRPHDLVARLGGDEFAVVFWDNEAPRQPGSRHPADAVSATERFRAVCASHDWKKGCNVQAEVHISGGLATFPWDAQTVDSLLAKADAALLRAKATGKNAIVLHES